MIVGLVLAWRNDWFQRKTLKHQTETEEQAKQERQADEPSQAPAPPPLEIITSIQGLEETKSRIPAIGLKANTNCDVEVYLEEAVLQVDGLDLEESDFFSRSLPPDASVKRYKPSAPLQPTTG